MIRVDDTKETNCKNINDVLEIGMIALFKNEQHVFNNEICLIVDTKHKHYRVELNGKKIWIPEHWITKL